MPIRALLFYSMLAICLSIPVVADSSAVVVKEIGSPALVSESRGFLAVEDSKGKKWLVGLVRDMVSDEGSRVSLVMIEPESGASTQYFYGEREQVTWDSFCLFVSSKKKVYTTMGGILLEFDLDERRFTYVQPKEVDGNVHAFSVAEDQEGRIYFASYPDARLEVYDPEAKTVEYVVRLDPQEKYPTTLAVDDDDWIYAAVGPANGLIIAYHRGTQELRQLVPQGEIVKESYPVILKEPDGKIYGSVAPQLPYQKPYYRLRGGAIIREESAPSLSLKTAAYPLNSLYSFRKEATLMFGDGSRIEEVDPVGRLFLYRDAKGVVVQKQFAYESRGAAISAMVAGSDGKLYGSTEHPMTFWQHDPQSGESTLLGRVKELGGGNMTHLVAWREEVVANTYSNGFVYRYDTSRAFAEDGSEPNPRKIDRTEPLISRPRALLIHPDGRHLVSAGFPGYGRTGGGLLIYDLQAEQRVALLDADDLCSGQSISALVASGEPDGDLYFGTSVWTPGGGATGARAAVIGRFSWKDQKVIWQETPIPGEETIIALYLKEGRLLGVTSSSILFAFDPATRKVIAQRDLKPWGEPVGRRGDTSFCMLPDGRLLLAMQDAVLEVEPETLETTLFARSPLKLRDGGVVLNGNLYYAAFNKLLSFKIPKLKP